MSEIKVLHTKNEDGVIHAHLKGPPLNGKKPSEIISVELECRIKALPVSDEYKEELRILIGSYGVLKAMGD